MCSRVYCNDKTAARTAGRQERGRAIARGESNCPDTGNAFHALAGNSAHFSCRSRTALVEALFDDPGSAHDPLTSGPAARQFSLAYSEFMPIQGQQEVLFFERDFGLVISNVTYDRDFDYDFVFEDLNFIQFRMEGLSLEHMPAGEALLVNRPGFKLSAAPEGYSQRSRLLASEAWRTITPFFGRETITRLLEEDEGDIRQVMQAFQHWQLQSGQGNHPFTPAVTEALLAVRNCTFTGQFRRLFLEAKTIELLCLVIAFLNEGPSQLADMPLSRRDLARLDEARDIIDRCFANPPTLSALSRMVGINRRKLTSGFRLRFGTTVLRYCVDRRMAYARELLENGTPICEVGERTGYSDQTSFSRAFRQFHGRPPKYFQPHLA